jgi:hypothetical protein
MGTPSEIQVRFRSNNGDVDAFWISGKVKEAQLPV